MSGIYQFHPESVSTDELRLQLKMRLPAVDLEHLNREQLVKIFKGYIMPMHKRSKHVHNMNGTEQSNQHPASQRTTHLKRKPALNGEKSTDGCKRSKFSDSQEEETTLKKRLQEGDIPTMYDVSPNQTKRKKITWP